MDNIQKINIDIMNNKAFEYIYTKQYDVGRQVVFTVTDDNKEVDLTDMTVMFEMMKPDGYIILDHCPTEDNKVILTLSQQMTTAYGKLPYQLNIYDQTKNVATVTGMIISDKAVLQNDDIESRDELNIIREIMEDIARIEALKVAAEAAAAAADTSEQHAAGSDTHATLQAKIAKSYAVGGTDYDHEGHDDDTDNSKYYYGKVLDIYNKTALAKKITLVAADWDSTTKLQTVEVEGVLGNEDLQLITVRPTQADTVEYVQCEVICIEQRNGYLVFQCDTIPQNDLLVYVAIQQTSNETIMGNVLYAPAQPSGGVLSVYRLNFEG